MKHRRASGLFLATLVGAGVSLSDAPSALSQPTPPACEKTVTAPDLIGTALNVATPIKIGVTFSGAALVLNGASTSGKVISDLTNLTASGVGTTQMVITGVRLITQSAGNVRFFVSSTEPPEWVEAYRCDNVTSTPQPRCVRFPRPAGRSLRWMAVMDNTAGTPSITRVQPIFDYLQDNEHYRGGIAVHEGVAYFGGFSQPGELGQLYAISTNFGTTHWTAREQLENSTRRIYTADGAQRIDFALGSSALANFWGVASADADAVVNWVMGPRFGPVGAREPFGGIISSTPVVVGRPELPVWFLRASSDRQAQFVQFRRDRFTRAPLVLYGAKDGMVHALHTDPRNIANPDALARQGLEAWGFVPRGIAARMPDDSASNLISAYPDTWPVVDDVLLRNAAGPDDDAFATIAVLAHGRGGTGISTIDITDTATGNALTGYSVTGPQPLWEQIPQDLPAYEPGLALSRPAIARVRLSGGEERYMVVAGTGLSYNDPERINQNGRVVTAYDAEDGSVYWKFLAKCPVTTAISVFETNDQGEPDPVPALDGFMDRAVFGDRCGNIYKVDLTRETAGGWARGIGGQQVDPPNNIVALFTTNATPVRPITGNIAVRAVVDADTTRVALFFGTGGLEEEPAFRQNFFYALAAAPDDPSNTSNDDLILERISGTCSGTPVTCEKFYGGVRVTPQQVIFTRVIEPPIGVGGAACDGQPGRTVIESRSLVGDISTAIDQQLFTQTVDSVITAPLTMAGNALYVADLRGRLTSIGDTSQSGASFVANQTSTTDMANAPMLILGWRQVY
ncbi:MAG TPA: PilC/PilY family type IV pilus protein [Haliangium sp.]|nr:PilC/PilY family type IV pilus protein [Haliangium sp.]